MINKHAPTDQKPFKCPHCDKGFALKGKLAEHINCHTNEKPFQCRFCELAFRNLSSRNYHEKTVHPDLFETIRRKYEKRKRPAKIEVDETLIE